MCELAPAPEPRADVDGDERAVDAPFSGLVFKVQANMDPRTGTGWLSSGCARGGSSAAWY